MNSDEHLAFVDGAAIPLEEIGPPATNYGQLRRWSKFKRVHYEYRMAAPVFLQRAAPWFDRYRAELRADDCAHPPETGTDAGAFAALDYPALPELLAAYPDLAGRLLVDLSLELNNLFAPARSDRIRYAANTVDRFSIYDGGVRFDGVAFDLLSKLAP
ncbi:hypothetical protein ACFOOP_10940 [Marinicaulis aureus]|uniref:Uncharacterized protein n=1 Tax=Hyphococcus aureus TaxID=2666033 RepID=A0ABW1KZW3_9PROT